MHGGDLSDRGDLATLDDVIFRLRARDRLEHEGRHRQGVRGVQNAGLLALGLGGRGDLDVGVTKHGLGNSLTVILKQGDGEVLDVGLLRGCEHVAAEHVDVGRAALRGDVEAVSADSAVILKRIVQRLVSFLRKRSPQRCAEEHATVNRGSTDKSIAGINSHDEAPFRLKCFLNEKRAVTEESANCP